MAGGSVVYIWEHWGIQILVVLSFILQVFLLCFAGIRRREGSTLMRTLLWLAYLMSDYIAIYALGHMSIVSRSHNHQLVPFWAPFLLLHLGGPDTITAYAFEDNQLWLRHLLTLVGQLIGAAYVIYQFVAVGRNPGTMLAAAALMFISGFLKYGERTWALKSASIDSISSSLENKSDGDRSRSPYHGREGSGDKRLDTEEVLLGAHYVRNVCKGILVDRPRMEEFEYKAIAQGIKLNGDMYLYELVGMELSLVYDILYTKAAVIHTRYGCFIRIISPLSALAASLLFLFGSKDAYGRVDIIVTYVLLAGAVVLEIASSLRAAGSSWACASFHAQGWHRLCSAVMHIRQLLKSGARRRTCLDSLGQYNLLDLCTRDVKDLRGKVAKAMGLVDWWQKFHYSSSVPVSPEIKALVLEQIRKMGIEDMKSARGRWILKKRRMYEDLMWIVDERELDHSIIVWHVATEFYLSMCPEDEADGTVRNVISVLSNHMLFLLVVHPYLLPGVVRHGRYKENYNYFTEVWQRLKEDGMNSSRTTTVKKIVNWQLPADSRYKYKSDAYSRTEDDDLEDRPAYVDGTRLAGMLVGNRWGITDMLQVIAGVWMEMLCYAGYRCGEESHARKLSSGGEFMTAVWFLMGHASLYDGFAPPAQRFGPVTERMPGRPAKKLLKPAPHEERDTQRPWMV